MALNKCPRCAELIQSDAKVCRHCNHQLGLLTTKNIVMACFTLLVVVYLASSNKPAAENAPESAAVIGRDRWVDGSGNWHETITATPVTIADLQTAYDDNEAKAQRDYGDQLLVIQGTVDDIDLDIFDNPVVTLREGALTINTFFKKSEGGIAAAELSKGQAASVVCRDVSETMGRPSLHECFVGTPKEDASIPSN